MGYANELVKLAKYGLPEEKTGTMKTLEDKAYKIGKCIMSCKTIQQLETLEKFIHHFKFNTNRTVYSIGIGIDIERLYLLKAKYLIYSK